MRPGTGPLRPGRQPGMEMPGMRPGFPMEMPAIRPGTRPGMEQPGLMPGIRPGMEQPATRPGYPREPWRKESSQPSR